MPRESDYRGNETMREIKFRIWDGYKYHYFESLEMFLIQFLLDNRCLPVISDTHLNCTLEGIRRKLRSCKKELCTGLKDKNGKEIYEGDIVFNKNLEDLLLVEYTKYSDIIIGLISGFYLKNNRNKILEHHLSLQDCEIIGNIYENPELLGEPKVYTCGCGESVQYTEEDQHDQNCTGEKE